MAWVGFEPTTLWLVIVDRKIFVKAMSNGSDDTTLTSKVKSTINFSEQQKKFCLSLHWK